MNAVEIKGLNKSFGKRTIIRDFDLTVREGEFIALMGPSGCGKSTLLNMIGLLEPSDSGTILLGGKKNPKVESSKATNLRRNTINYLFQSYALINDATVMDNLLCGMYFLDISDKEKKKRASSVLKKVGLLELKNEKVNTLSGGEMQRVAIARCILKPGDIILADEPTGALDVKTAESVFRLLLALRDEYNKTIIMVTHSPELARRADRIVSLSQL
ncbi:MAG: ABC transporter ATP-binding protein [Clostridiales bacterium]|nr:ABC transporter ATP-binding protein [Clostridiales bacterium]